MRRTAKLLPILACTGVLGLLYAFCFPKPRANREPADFAALRSWLQFNYVPIQAEQIPQLVKQIPMNLQGRIEEHLQEQARQAACQFLLAFSSGEYSNYQRFHFPLNAKVNQDFYEKFRASVTATNLRPILSPPPKWAADKSYLAANSNIWPPLLSPPPPFPVAVLTPTNFCQLLIEQASCGTYYKGYFAALSITNSSISVQRITVLPQSLESFVTASTPNIGTVSLGKHFEFETSPAQVLEKHKVLFLVTCKLVVRLKPPDTVVPQFVRYYYDPDADALLPCEYVLANVMRASYVFPWF